ncbi:Bacterial DnaG primase, TOPRIM domain [uncultured Caudovirales phage]|uniref:Bacterial DnaG primase, TOPRIM domain n=1 Tax=uncultured Caudovirales phage TaxID=2100421 RepID=A0A6J5KLX9_9CAUD|nr:Bacterial DnaG primase, TOPRIM domain [uncultured Caudovirales phage]
MYAEGSVEGALLSLGIETSQRGDELLGLCPMHLERTGREDNNPSWSINAETGVHHCFSCGYKGTLLTLVGEIKEFTTQWGRVDFDAAKDWLRNNIEVNFEYLAKQLEDARNTYITIAPPVEMSEARLAIFDGVAPEWALSARGLEEDACALYGVKWNSARNSWITPIRNPKTHALMGWQEKSQTERFFRNRPTGVAKSRTMFGLNAYKGGTMIVVESPLDAVKLQSLGISGGVSTFGAAVSDQQLRLMRSSDKLIIAMDNDAAGKKSALDLLVRVRKEGMECWFVNYKDVEFKDIGDMSEDLVHYCIETSKHCVFGEAAING